MNKTSSTLLIDNVAVSHGGNYYCVVTNPHINDVNFNSVKSEVSTVEVLNYPVPGNICNCYTH